MNCTVGVRGGRAQGPQGHLRTHQALINPPPPDEPNALNILPGASR